MKWSEKYATGIPHIDEQHRQIFKAAEDFRTALDFGEGAKTYSELLDFLDRYIRAHFGFEDRCMIQYKCPAAEKNREAHAGFTKTLGRFQAQYASRGFDASDARDLVDTLDRWFASHILAIDTTLKDLAASSPP